MSDTDGTQDALQTLRERVALAATPAERVKAELQLADKLWLRDPSAAKPFLEHVVAESGRTGQTADGGRAASILSEMLRRSGDLDASSRYAELVFKAADATGDRRVRASGLNLIGMIHQERGELDRALECFEGFLKLSRETGFMDGEQSALNQLAGVYGLQGQSERALACYRQCLEASRTAGDSYGRAISLHNIGWTLESMGRWTEAAEHFHRTIALSEEHDFRDPLLAARMALGELSLKRSDYENAALMFEAVIKVERETGHSGQMFREALSNLGWVHFRSGNHAQAELRLDEAARLSEKAEDRCLLATIDCRRAELALARGLLDSAVGLVAKAERCASELNLPKQLGEALRVQALLSEAHGKPDAALLLFTRAEDVLKPLGDTYELALARFQRGRLLLGLGRSKEALPLLKTTVRTFHRLSVVAEAEEANRLLYQLEVRIDPEAAFVQGLFSLNSLSLAPEIFIERALQLLCDSFRFKQGAVFVDGHAVALKGNPDLTGLPKRRSLLSETDLELFLPIKEGRRLLGFVWLGRKQPLAARVATGNLGLVSRTLAPALVKLRKLRNVESPRALQIPGLRFRGVVGCNREVLDALNQVPRVAAGTMSVLIYGETGTGKELVARALHESGPRAEHQFITVNCAAVPESLLEAEFFGVEAGAATGVAARPGKFEQAHSGTIFLDEIGDMSPALQARLLRVIEDHKITRVGGTKETPVDVWVIAATNKDLTLRASEGKFRTDLLYRLNTVLLVLPPLRLRREDIPALTDYFITRTAQQHDRTVHKASDEVVALFAEYSWPGNIRQLKHAIQRAVVLAAGDTVEVSDLPLELRQTQPASAVRSLASISGARRKAADEAERAMLVEALSRAKGNATQAMKLTGYSRTHFYRLLRKHHIIAQSTSD
jgi:DNA-binding NtrC family response regulator/tetratricopeptide (TPR) repeat protein